MAIDEGQLNACGTCGDTPEETCNGVDDDCDGLMDEDANLCGSGLECAGVNVHPAVMQPIRVPRSSVTMVDASACVRRRMSTRPTV